MKSWIPWQRGLSLHEWYLTALRYLISSNATCVFWTGKWKQKATFIPAVVSDTAHQVIVNMCFGMNSSLNVIDCDIYFKPLSAAHPVTHNVFKDSCNNHECLLYEENLMVAGKSIDDPANSAEIPYKKQDCQRSSFAGIGLFSCNCFLLTDRGYSLSY